MSSIKQLHTFLFLLSPFSVFETYLVEKNQDIDELIEPISLILKGHSSKVLSLKIFKDLFQFENTPKEFLNTKELNQFFGDFFQKALYNKTEIEKSLFLIYAIALLQCFTRLNFTGPSIFNFEPFKIFLPNVTDSKKLNDQILDSLHLQGLQVYKLCDDPILLFISLHILENLTNSQDWSLFNEQTLITKTVEEVSINANKTVENVLRKNSITSIMANLWRSRALQIQMSLFNDNSSVISSICGEIFNIKFIEQLIIDNNSNNEIINLLLISYHLENAKNSYQAQIENFTISSLEKAKTLSKFELILTGAKAKKTKYQQNTVSSLIILARSNKELLSLDELQNSETLILNQQLNDDLLLEVPYYESLNDEAINEILENDNIESGRSIKKIKLSFEAEFEEIKDDKKTNHQKLLPIAIRSKNIPESLKQLNTNEQPRLNDLDNIQLFLRMKTLKQISPSGNHLIEEELMALISRIIANNSDSIKKNFPSINWLIFSKALWERSLLEANKAKTIERGIFQMQALVEELNSKIQSRLFTQNETEEDLEINASATRLRFINQLPLAPRWSLDVELAEKFMSVGVIKSAVEIYERLQMIPEMAVCYASVGQENKAKEILSNHLKTSPNDSRCLSILGGLTDDPKLWEKAWELNKYQNAKVSLARYYYNRKHKDSKNINLAIAHMHEVLTYNPLNFQNWYFYGCLGLETSQYELASEAFTRCVSIDDTHNHSWSNLGSALLNSNKPKEAFNAYQNAIRTSEVSSWRIWENYLLTAIKINDWIQAIRASKTLIELKKDESAINLKVVNVLANELVNEKFDDEKKLTFFQKSCIDYICNQIPKINTKSSELWKIQSKIELWRKKPWNSLSCMEKAFRVDLNNENLISDESIWNNAVDSCIDLLAAYESLGELPGKFGADDLICKDWKFKSRSTVRSLMNKGKISWEDSNGWDRLVEAKEDL